MFLRRPGVSNRQVKQGGVRRWLGEQRHRFFQHITKGEAVPDGR